MVDFVKLRSNSTKGHISYSNWWQRVGNVMLHRTGLDINDFPWPYIHQFDEGLTPSEVVDSVITREKLEEID